MEMQILDCDYIVLNNKPLIRIFGRTESGEAVCGFYDNFLPYFYLQIDEDKIEDAKFEMEKNDLEVEVVERTLPIGFQGPQKVLKIIGKDPSEIPKVKDFAKRFGTPYEADILFRYRFMTDFGLKGMSWVRMEGKPVFTKTVKCKAFEIDKITPIVKEKDAPLKYLALDIECVSQEDRNVRSDKDQIIMISLAFEPEFKGKKQLVLVAKQIGDTNVIGCDDEKEMLKKFIEILNDYDPDILIGYNINGFDLPYIIDRLGIFQMPKDLGRTEKNAYYHKMQNSVFPYICGRVVVDPFEIIKRDPWVKYKRYNLGTIAKELLKMEKIEMKYNEIREYWHSMKNIKKVIEYCGRDAELAMKLVLERRLLTKFIELSKISGLLLQDSFGGQTQRHECKLLSIFREKGYIMPCRPDGAEMKKRNIEREKFGLKGALVLEPDTGFHSKGAVIVLDFASLYPSIIRSNNICTTTLLRDDVDVEFTLSPYNTKFVKKNVREGILPIILKELLESRRAVKSQLKKETDPDKKRVLNARQLALKDMANSLYGYIGYVRARLYVIDIANTVTAYGRENIVFTKKLIEENFPVKVLYGDTDSMFIKTTEEDLEQIEKLGQQISTFVTEKLSGLELKFEKIFKTFLIIAKKRYAGLSYERENGNWVSKIEMKGIETVRRDWCLLTSETMLEVLNIILKEQDVKKATKHVRNVINELAKGRIPLEKLAIVKGVTKAIDDYEGMQPHVELAKKIMKRDPGRGSIYGERLEFVIVKGNQIMSKRAEDPAYVKEKGLEIDSQYYIENQLLPPLERIFEVCGVSSLELMDGFKQRSLMDILNGQKPILSPDETVLKNFESVVCKSCDWNFRRPTLSGLCPNCNSQLYFSDGASVGKTISSIK